MVAKQNAYYENFANLITKKEKASTPLEYQTICLFGDQGKGKTSLAASFPNHLYIDLEKSLGDSHEATLLDIRTWADFKRFVDYAAAGGDLQGAKTLVIDTVNDLWERCVVHNLADRKLTEMPDDFGRTLKAIRKDFTDTIDKLRDMGADQKLGTIFIAHEEVEERTAGIVKKQILRPMVTDKFIKHYIGAKPQMVLRAFNTQTNPMNATESWPEAKFILQCRAVEEGAVIKDRTDTLPAYVSNNYQQLLDAYNNGQTKNKGTK